MIRGGHGWVAGRGPSTVGALALGLVLGAHLMISAAPAQAAHPEVAPAAEAELLGAQHAAEHQRLHKRQVRALRRWRRLPRAKRHKIRARHERRARLQAAATTADAGPPSVAGRWTVPPFPLPAFAIHAALLPTGKVLFYSYPPLDPNGSRPNEGRAALWDPKKGTGPDSMTEVPPPIVDHDGDPATPEVPVPVFCSGQSFLPSGELLVTGGHLIEPLASLTDPYTGPAGIRMVVTFDPWAEAWTLQPSMAKGRWYPTQTLLADGRTVIVSGYTEDAPGKVLNSLVEEYTPAPTLGGQGAVAPLNGADRTTNLYPRMFLMPDGDVLMTGPGQYHVAKLSTDAPGEGAWTGMGALAPLSIAHVAGTAALRSGAPDGSWEVTSIGGMPLQAQGSKENSGTTVVETLDHRNPAAGWAPEPSLQIPRAHHNTVVLPNGEMVTVGGGVGLTQAEGNWAVDPEGAQRQVEIFNPATETWTLGAAEVEDRAYHSTALLLADGRIWSAGDDHNPRVNGAISNFDTAEVYTPPALYRGRRPRIRRHASAIHWGDEFTVETYADTEPPVGAVLMAPAAVTHGVDMSARRIELEVTQPHDEATRTIKVKAPPTPEVAPPGRYMLFLLSATGNYSAAPWTLLAADAPDAP